MRGELVYMQHNIRDSQSLFCFVLNILRMAGLDTLFLCSVGQQAWLYFQLIHNIFAKIIAFVLIKLFLQNRV